jgi:hypothetical protein
MELKYSLNGYTVDPLYREASQGIKEENILKGYTSKCLQN